MQPIAPWGGYLLSVDDLTVTFVDKYGVSHVGVVDMELGDGADWLNIEEIFVQLDAYHTQIILPSFQGAHLLVQRLPCDRRQTPLRTRSRLASG